MIEFKLQRETKALSVSSIDTRYTFKSWNDSNTSNPRTIVLEENKELFANLKTSILLRQVPTLKG
ncbi:hypothetical protein [Mesotoga sp.]|uniref:hypothetical protein n=1 Tax=Mesotoga sp. TaxID=2053577 RepID=UPI00345E16DF